MTQPPASDGDQGAGPGPGEGLPGEGLPGGGVRDPRLAGFAPGGAWHGEAPGPGLAAVLAAVGGPEWRCPGRSRGS